jgi:hypothetical protein
VTHRRRRIIVAVEPFVLGGALADLLRQDDDEVVVIDLRDRVDLPPGRFDAAVVTGSPDVEADVVIQLPDTEGGGGTASVLEEDGVRRQTPMSTVTDLIDLLGHALQGQEADPPA